MFAGIVQQQGKLIHKKRQGKQIALTFEAQKVWDKPLKRGESISVSGVCLTLFRSPKKNQFTVQAIPETLARTAINHLSPKESVNLERSLTWGERIGGHFVLGHVDGVGRILRKTVRGQNFTLDIEVPAPLIPYLVPQGSIAVDGISFTLQKISSSSITIAVIPHTAKTTTMGRKRKGNWVNLESDVIAKHLAQMVHSEER